MKSRIALGTAQFGLDYGVANKTGRVGEDEARVMLKLARENGIDTVDTAITYGESEACLGRIGVQDLKVISKLPAVPEARGDVETWVRESVNASLRRLGTDRLYGLLLHRPLELRGSNGYALWRGLAGIKREGVVEKIGVSVYGPDDLEGLVSEFTFDLIQAPLNVLDRRLSRSGWLSRLHEAGTEVHVRSVFLQGLLLMSSGERPRQFDRWQALWRTWDAWLRDMKLTPAQACLGFAMAHLRADRVVVGADSYGQLEELLVSIQSIPTMPPEELSCEDPELIDPSRWSLA